MSDLDSCIVLIGLCTDGKDKDKCCVRIMFGDKGVEVGPDLADRIASTINSWAEAARLHNEENKS